MQEGYADNLTIDRIDVYETMKIKLPRVTIKEQASNRRTNIIITINNVTQTFKEHCENTVLTIAQP